MSSKRSLSMFSSGVQMDASALNGWHRLDERDDGAKIQAYLLAKTKQRTVPNIFIRSSIF